MKKLSNIECQLAQLQELCGRTLIILNEEKFFQTAVDNEGYGHTSLERDLRKASQGKEFKMFIELMKHLPCTEKKDGL